ncbi:MAG: class II aldolase/adducin family protein [Lachnospiraceae bacterium]|jgi:ribulose-5-phosphate 4-epimerase/fuculose-1-phosphate aldolase|nr:class II aldolase/adducin family protein [Lachnospiraceae bacterium]
MNREKYREILLAYTKKAYENKLFAGTSGNLSIYDDENDCIYITPSSIPYENMECEDMVVITMDGTVLEGKHQPSSEWKLHANIYKERKEIKAVVHTHSPYATAFAVANMPIPMILVEMLPSIGDAVQVAGFALPGDEKVGIEAVKALEGRKGCLLKNHGAVAIGEEIESAYITAVYIEDAARIYYLASTVGKVGEIPEEQLEIFRQRMK